MIRRVLAALAVVAAVAACDPRVVIPSIGVDRPVVQGRQTELDAGHVVELYPNYLGGHRSTHGSVFRNVPSLDPYDRATFDGQSYFVYGRRLVPQDCHNVADCKTAGDLILQTSVLSGEHPNPSAWRWQVILVRS